MMPPREMLTAKEVARMLKVSLRTVRRMRSEGLLPHPVVVRRGLRWPEDELRAWIDAGRSSRSAVAVRRSP